MKQPDLLIIDLGNSETFSSVLRETLQSSSIVRTHVLKNNMESFDARSMETFLTGLISFFAPDVIMLVLPAGGLRKEQYKFQEGNWYSYIPLASIDIPGSFDIAVILRPDAPTHLFEAGGKAILSVIWYAIGHYTRSARAGTRRDMKAAPLVGRNLSFLNQVEKVPRAALCDSGVLIEGEPGTGKKTLACRIHSLGNRAGRSFVRMDCTLIPPDLIEMELFGQETRDYRGKVVSQRGLIQKAHGGTLFIEEIEKLPASVQIRLLQLLREGTFKPVGSSRERPADVRLIGALAGSNGESVSKSNLRRDFYYALSVIPFKLPALRQRREDILPLALHFLESYCSKSGTRVVPLSDEVLLRFALYDWPGNLTELKHSVERAAFRSRTSTILESDIALPGRDELQSSLSEAKRRFLTRFGASSEVSRRRPRKEHRTEGFDSRSTLLP